MEESISRLWQISIWYWGISATITVGLFGWLMKIQTRISIGESIEKDLKKMSMDLDEIKVALKGDYEKKGLFTRYFELESRVDKLELINGESK